MRMRWSILFLVTTFVLGVSVLKANHGATAAPQAPAGAAVRRGAAPATAAKGSAGSFAIPDTTLAINSDKPLSQRVVHYEIDARYDASKHTIDATELLTYHNLTGQPLDHFPFHLYQ